MKRKLKYPLDYKVVETTDGDRVIARSRNLENGLLQLRRAEDRAKKSKCWPNRKFKLITPMPTESEKLKQINELANALWDWSNMLDDTNLDRLRKIIGLSGGVVCRTCNGSKKFQDTDLECPDCKPSNDKLTHGATQ